jgi:diguanylate cyclase (GGDEF)-like protein
VVVISDDAAGVECPTVRPDNRSGIRAAVEHLIGHGHRRIAFAGHLRQPDAAERHDEYCRTLLAHGLVPQPGLLFATGDMQEAGGERAAAAMLAAGLPSTAVVCGNDQNAIGLLRALTEAGCDLPADQAVIGFDDLPGGAYVTPSLTTVRQPLDEIGDFAVQLVLGLLNGDPPSAQEHRLATTLVVRESCGCPGPLSMTGHPPGDRDATADRLLAGICAAMNADSPARRPKVHPAELEVAVKNLTTALASPEAVSGPDLRRILLPISQRMEEYEIMVAVMRLIRDHSRAVTGATGADDDAVYQIFVLLAQAQSSSQAARGRSTMSALGTQYSVSMQLLRSQERDPRSLEWLRSTDVRGGCLGLWPENPERRGRYLDVITTFDRRTGTTTEGTGEAEIERFPPAVLVEMAELSADDMVYVAHLKVGDGDWGMLALVGPVQATLAEGRETMNQWAALLSVALEHDLVLRTMREQEEVLRQAARYDDLTGLPNRSQFRDRLTTAIARPGHRYAVLMMDLDGFKQVNDTLGHEAGDRLLQEVGRRLTAQLHPNELVARLGGDEFAVLIEDLADLQAPAALAERLQDAVSAPVQLAGQEAAVTTSIGIALGNQAYTDTQAVMRDADAAMYCAKSNGKRTYELFTPEMRTAAQPRER